MSDVNEMAVEELGLRPRRVGLISLGCAKNLVDAEVMLGSLLKGGVEITNDPDQADALIVNTCSFIDAAQEESVDTILESAAYRDAKRKNQALIVSGCLPQRFRNELPTLLPEVDAFMGVDQVEEVGRIVEEAIVRRGARIEPETGKGTKTTKSAKKGDRSIEAGSADRRRRLGDLLQSEEGDESGDSPSPGEGKSKAESEKSSEETLVTVHVRPKYVPSFDSPRFRLTPSHFAYLKIAEGCNHPCSFCIIPRMRGSHRSRAQADIVAEAKALIADGVREINLISQDSTYYGLDLRPKASRAIASPARFREATAGLSADATTLCTLLRELDALPGEFRVRLLYTHPAHWTDDLIRTLAECPKVARYVDMPLQHIHDDMLERMRRETTGQYIRDLIQRIRAGVPGIAVRTTFIVGFPGETEACFRSLVDFIEETRFERLGVFAYSKEDGTVAGRMSSQVAPAVRKKRRELAMAAQLKVAREIGAAQVGQVMQVLVDGESKGDVPVRSWEHGLLRDGGGDDAMKGRKKGRWSVARGEADAPDIDGRVYVRGVFAPGEWLNVRVVGHSDYDLLAEVTDRA